MFSLLFRFRQRDFFSTLTSVGPGRGKGFANAKHLEQVAFSVAKTRGVPAFNGGSPECGGAEERIGGHGVLFRLHSDSLLKTAFCGS